jgi:hypothetical protein
MANTINIEENKYQFIEMLKNQITREGAAVDKLIYKLEHSDFFTAPCSLRYHLAVPGGLCQHSLNVFNELVRLNTLYEAGFSNETLAICGLLLDIEQMNKFELTSKNTKVYCETGSKSDILGKFEWKSELGYQVKDVEDRFIYGHHGQNSEYIINSYIPLTLEESVAITNHMGGIYDEYRSLDMPSIFKRYSLATLLYMADFMCTYMIDSKFEN